MAELATAAEQPLHLLKFGQKLAAQLGPLSDPARRPIVCGTAVACPAQKILSAQVLSKAAAN
jgi:hypothetical protein